MPSPGGCVASIPKSSVRCTRSRSTSPAEPRYSQSIAVVAHLTRSTAATGVAGTDCSDLGSPPCSVSLTIAPAASPDDVTVINAQGFVTDSNGDTSGAHIIFVDGVPDD